MTDLREVLQKHVDDGAVPGAVALVARGDQAEVAVVGSVDVEGTAPMARDTIFRAASITKAVTATAVLMLIEDGRIALDDAVSEWLPELSSPMVVRTPSSPVDDVVPAARPITVADLLTFRAGYGFPDDFSLPAVQELFAVTPGRDPLSAPAPDEWMALLSRIPLLHQPGEAWLYNTCSDIQGVLIARVSGQSFPDFLAERVFGPVGMPDTAFHVPADKLDRLPSYYQPAETGGLELLDAPDGQWSRPAPFPSGAGGGLVTTLDDWYAFDRMLLADGVAASGDRLLTSESLRLMTTDHLTQAQRDGSRLFLEGQGWGYGGSVDVARIDPWNVPGRFGWAGGTGTAAHVVPDTGLVSLLFTQVAMTGPTAPDVMRDFWRYAAGA
jgi:CubicO group peptidase (beta-lactamase class C family)